MKGSCGAQNQLDSFSRFDRTPSDGQADTDRWTDGHRAMASTCASDSFSRFLALYKFVCIHVCMYVCRAGKKKYQYALARTAVRQIFEIVSLSDSEINLQ